MENYKKNLLTSEVLVQLIKKTNGSIHAIGSHEIDKENTQNLTSMGKILFDLVGEVCEEASNCSSPMGSVNANGQKAVEILKELKELIDDTLSDVAEATNN